MGNSRLSRTNDDTDIDDTDDATLNAISTCSDHLLVAQIRVFGSLQASGLKRSREQHACIVTSKSTGCQYVAAS